MNFMVMIAMATTAQAPSGLTRESFDLIGATPPPAVAPVKKQASLFTTGPKPPVVAVPVPKYRTAPVQAEPEPAPQPEPQPVTYRVVRRYVVNPSSMSLPATSYAAPMSYPMSSFSSAPLMYSTGTSCQNGSCGTTLYSP